MKDSAAKTNEMGVLGCILLDNKTIYQAIGELQDDDFKEVDNRKLFKLIKKLILDDKRDDVDIVLLNQIIDPDDDIKPGYLADLLNVTPTSGAISKFISKVKERSFKLQLASFFTRANHEIQNSKTNLEGLIDAKEYEFKILLDTFRQKDTHGVFEPKDYIDDTLKLYQSFKDNPNRCRGIKTGFDRLDKIIKGLRTMNIVSATTGMGKTAFALNLMANISLVQGIPILYINHEMDKDDLIRRFVSIVSDVESDNIQDGIYRQEEWDSVKGILNVIKAVGTSHLTDNSAKSINKIRSLIYHYKNRKDIKVVFVDYIGEIEPDDQALKEKNEYLTYGRYTQALKEICADLDISCVLLTQLGRMGEDDPKRKNIQGSWKIVQKADVMLILYFDVKENVFKVKIEKLRHGKYPFEIKFDFKKSIHKFVELPGDDSPF